jgi:hypothetical protein
VRLSHGRPRGHRLIVRPSENVRVTTLIVCEVLYIPHLRENLFFVKHHGGIHIRNGKGLF